MKDAFGRVAYMWTGAKNVRSGAGADEDRVDGKTLVQGRGQLRAGRQRRIGRRRHRRVPRRTARRRAARPRAWSPPTAGGSGRGRWAARPSATRRTRRSSQTTTAGRSTSGSTGRCRTSSTAAIGRRRSASRSRWNRTRSRSAFPRRSQHEHREHRSRRPGSSPATMPDETLGGPGDCGCCATRSQRLRWSDGFSHARSMAFLPRPDLRRGRHRPGGSRERARVRRVERRDRPWSPAAVPGPAGRVLTDAVTQAHQAGTGSRYVALRVGLDRRAHHRHHAHGPDRACDQSALRRRAGPAHAAEVRARVRARRARPVCWRCSASPASRSATSIGTSFHNDLWTTSGTSPAGRSASLFITGAIALLFRRAPRRHQPGWSWLALGRARGRGAVVVGDRRSMSSSASARRSARPTDRSPASWRCCSGRSDRRSPCSTAVAWPRSSKPCVPASRAAATRRIVESEPRRRSADGRRLPIDDAGA